MSSATLVQGGPQERQDGTITADSVTRLLAKSVIDKQSLIRALRDLGDERFQWDAWVHGKSGAISSFPELACQVFDDTGLSRALNRGSLEPFLGASADETLRELSATIDRVPEHKDASALVRSSDMQKVRELANKARREIMKHLGATASNPPSSSDDSPAGHRVD